MFTRRASGKVTDWFVVFSPCDQGPLWNVLIRGRFKHVWAFGCAAPAATWVFLDPRFGEFGVSMIPSHEAVSQMAAAIGKDDAVLRMPAAELIRQRVRFFYCCTTIVRHLLGIGGGGLLGVFPDRLYRDMIRAGAVCVAGDVVPDKSDAHGIFSIS